MTKAGCAEALARVRAATKGEYWEWGDIGEGHDPAVEGDWELNAIGKEDEDGRSPMSLVLMVDSDESIGMPSVEDKEFIAKAYRDVKRLGEMLERAMAVCEEFESFEPDGPAAEVVEEWSGVVTKKRKVEFFKGRPV